MRAVVKYLRTAVLGVASGLILLPILGLLVAVVSLFGVTLLQITTALEEINDDRNVA